MVYAVEEALRIIDDYQPPAGRLSPVEARPGVGHGVSEAPRGLLYHRYEIDEDGLIAAAVIVPPTSQNQAAIEDDLARVVVADERTRRCRTDRDVRTHDPQLRPVHLVRHALPHADGWTAGDSDAGIVVIGIGNDHRRDDGIGPAVAAAVAARGLPGVRVHRCAAEPTAILDAWDGSRLSR